MTQPRLLGDRYELDEVVGRGGMAEVYRARDIRLDRQVAVKTLRADLARDPTFQARFRREAQSAASLNHPAVIAVYDTGEAVDQYGTSIPYIVMEYADGHTLRELVHDDQRQLLPERAAEIVDGVLRALEYSHRSGIVHRDIKPANVMLTRNGDVKVMDFGIARALSDNQVTMTQTAQVIGTAQYLSPEQARGERVDPRSDIYSTGCMFYELLTGQPPFSGDSPVAIAYQHVREDPIPPSQIDPEVPQWADAIVLKAMAKDREDRYQDAGEMRADIQRALSGMAISAPTMVAAAGGTQMMGQPQAAPPTGTLPPNQYRDEDLPPERSGRGKKVALWVLLAVLIIGGAALAGYFLLGNSGPDHTTVPSVVGKTRSAAVKDLKAANLKSDVQRGFSNDQPKGKVFKTDPSAHTSTTQGDTVTLYVSKGEQKVTIPKVGGRSEEQAKSLLSDKGFDVRTVMRHSDNVSQGTAIGTRPKAGDTATKGSTVKLYVSSGSQQVQVPNVTGQQVGDAKRAIGDKGLKPAVHTATTDQAEPGTVVKQAPSSGSLPLGGTVTLTVAKAPEEETPPTDEPSNPEETPPPDDSSPPPETPPSDDGGGDDGGGGGMGGDWPWDH